MERTKGIIEAIEKEGKRERKTERNAEIKKNTIMQEKG